jgi:hypothetical protein
MWKLLAFLGGRQIAYVGTRYLLPMQGGSFKNAFSGGGRVEGQGIEHASQFISFRVASYAFTGTSTLQVRGDPDSNLPHIFIRLAVAGAEFRYKLFEVNQVGNSSCKLLRCFSRHWISSF